MFHAGEIQGQQFWLQIPYPPRPQCQEGGSFREEAPPVLKS